MSDISCIVFLKRKDMNELTSMKIAFKQQKWLMQSINQSVMQ